MRQGPPQNRPDRLPSNLEVFGQEFDLRFEAWKSEWVTPRTGPLYIRESILATMTEEQLEAHRPEMEARKAIIDCVVKAIAKAPTAQERIEIVKHMKRTLSFNLMGGQKSIAYELTADILQAVVA